MAKATIVKITSVGEDGIGIRWDGKYLTLNSFDYRDKNLKISAPLGYITLETLAEFIVGCFKSRSTFENVHSVTFTFQGITTTVHRNEVRDNPANVISKWEKSKKEWEAFLKS